MFASDNANKTGMCCLDHLCHSAETSKKEWCMDSQVVRNSWTVWLVNFANRVGGEVAISDALYATTRRYSEKKVSDACGSAPTVQEPDDSRPKRLTCQKVIRLSNSHLGKWSSQRSQNWVLILK